MKVSWQILEKNQICDVRADYEGTYISIIGTHITILTYISKI